MPVDSNSSFIPKRSPSTRPVKQPTRQFIGAFSYISYTVFFGSVIAAILIFLYSLQVQSTLADRQSTLTEAKNDFSQAQLDEILEFELLINTAEDIFNKSISLAPIFNTLQDSIIETAQIDSLTIERPTPHQIILSADIRSNNFDSALFQRNIYRDFELLKNFTVTNVVFERTDSQVEGSTSSPNNSSVTYTLTAHFSIDQVPFAPESSSNFSTQPLDSTSFTDDSFVEENTDFDSTIEFITTFEIADDANDFFSDDI